MRYRRIFFIALLFLVVSTLLTAQNVRVSISSREGYVGLPLQYMITITGSKEAQIPQLSGLEDFDVSYQGKNQSSQTSIVNGSRTSSISVQFTWQLTPRKEGNLIIPSQTIEVEGETVHTASGTVTIRPPGKVEGFKLLLDSDQKSAYRGQSMTVNLDFYVSREVGNLNFSLPGQSKGSREKEDFLILESRLPDRSGNDIRQIPVGNRTFYGYVSSRLEGGEQYTILTIPLDIMPLHEGPLSLEGATVSFSVEEGVWPRSNTVSHVIAAEPLTLTAKELPEEIRESPNGVLLARGDLKVRSLLSASEARPGDPLTLTVELDGLINPDYCEIPPLEEFSDLDETFSLPSSRSRPRVDQGILSLVQTIRPISVKSNLVPPLEFIYLNLETNQVSRVSTEPIVLTMSSAGNLSANDLEVFGENQEEQDRLIANEKGIRQNKSIQSVIIGGDQRTEKLTLPVLVLIFLPPLIFLFQQIIMLIGRLLYKKSLRDKQNPYKQFLLSCENELNCFAPLDRYIRDKYFNGKSFTRKELEELTEKKGVRELYSLYIEGEQSRYAGEEARLNRDRVISIVREQEKRS
jgi:hypothetical protein